VGRGVLLARGLITALLVGASSCNSAGLSAPPAAPNRAGPAADHAVAAPRSVPIDGYVLKQDGKTVGSQIITVTPKGLRCESIKSHIIVLCAAPDWQVLIYNPQTKRSITTPFKLFRGYLQKQLVLFSGTSYFDKPVVLKSKKEFFDLPGMLFTEPPGYPARIYARYRQKLVGGGEPAQIVYKVLQLPGVTKEEESVLERYYSVPEKGGLPLEFSWVSVCAQRRSFLTTSQAKGEKVDEALFKPPTGLIACKNVEEVFLDGRSEGTDDLFNMFQKK
jgi:hypothetical protein